MSTLYLVSVTIHVLTAMLWVGGMGMFALVVVPATRRAFDHPKDVGVLLRAVGHRLGRLTPWLLGTLISTGVINLWCRGILGLLGTARFWATSFGTSLAIKLVFVASIVAASTLHARLARQRLRSSRGAWLGRATLVLSVVVVALAVILVRGGVS